MFVYFLSGTVKCECENKKRKNATCFLSRDTPFEGKDDEIAEMRSALWHSIFHELYWCDKEVEHDKVRIYNLTLVSPSAQNH